jgi:site-specific DNA-adenine methylase
MSNGTNLVNAAKKEFDSIVKLMKNKNSWEKFGYNNRRFWHFIIKDNMIQNISELFGLSNTNNNKDQFWITISRHNVSIDKWEVDILYIDQNGSGWCDLTGCNKKVKYNVETLEKDHLAFIKNQLLPKHFKSVNDFMSLFK